MIFIVAGVGKLLMQSSSYEPLIYPARMPQLLSDAVSLGLPYAEIIIGLLLVCGIATRLSASISALLIAGFIASNFSLLGIGVGTCGNCFGVAGGLTVYAALTLDGIMAALRGLYVAGIGDPGIPCCVCRPQG